MADSKNDKRRSPKKAGSTPESPAAPRRVKHAAGASIRPPRKAPGGQVAAPAAKPEPGRPPKFADAGRPVAAPRDQADVCREFATAADAACTEVQRTRKVSPSTLLGLRRLLGELERSQGQPTELAAFFRSVGDGVLAAQQDLDAASAAYSKALPAHATAYRIPKVSAEINFAITSVTSSGFNVFIAKQESELKDTQQQKVSFDIVAAPAPPELRAELGRRNDLFAAALASGLLLDPGRRAAVIGRLDDSALPADVRQVVPEFKQEPPDRLVMFEAGGGVVVAKVVPMDPPSWDAIVLAAPPSRSEYFPGIVTLNAPSQIAYLFLRLAEMTAAYLQPPAGPR